MVVLLLFPPLSHCDAEVYRLHILPGYEHVALIISGVGGRVLIDEQTCVLYVPVNEMQSEVGAAGFPPWKGPKRPVYGCGHPRECHPVLIKRRERKWLQ